MKSLIEELVLERVGPAEATVGLVSLPLPRDAAEARVRVDHPGAGAQPVGWWVRNELPRRELVAIVDGRGLPETLRMTGEPAPANNEAPASRWHVSTCLTREQLDYKRSKWTDLASLRGVPVEDCTAAEYELLLGFGGREIAVEFCATGPSGDAGRLHPWQNVQVDRLWSNAAAEAVRVGGIIYNGDTYLWVDLYLLLFANGVAHAAAHFVNTKLHIEGYDFRGLPAIRFKGEGVGAVDVKLPGAGGARLDLGALKLNLADAAILSSEQHPAVIRGAGGSEGAVWQPFSRTFNPQLPDAPPLEWAAGMARTVRFQFSLSDAPPLVARYRVPGWWYALAGELWPGGYLPVSGEAESLALRTADAVRKAMVRGRFDAGSADFANDGFAGTGLLRVAQLTGDDGLYRDAIDYCYYWADVAVDHRDYTVHQWLGGWPWKTCAYTKFRDVLFGYLETGDPNLLDTAENCADTYWAWFRANWPRNTIGRDNFELAGWALMRRYTRSERAVERTREFVRMTGAVVETRGTIGGQMGAGPHPGYLSSLYMTGVTMISLLEVADAEWEEGYRERVEAVHPLLAKLHRHWMAEDVELFPSAFGELRRANWGWSGDLVWRNYSGRIYAAWARLGGPPETTAGGLRKRAATPMPTTIEDYLNAGRPGDNLVNPLYADALMLGARVTSDGRGVELNPLGQPGEWPARQMVHTPWGAMAVSVEPSDGRVVVTTRAARAFPVTIHDGGRAVPITSDGSCEFPASTMPETVAVRVG